MSKVLTAIVLCFAATNAGKLQPRIINGQIAYFGQFPYIASVQDSRTHTHYCAGSIIHKNWILTAAHCFVHDCPNCQAKDISVVFDAVTLDGLQGIRRPVRQIIAHEAHDFALRINDLALLEVEWPLYSALSCLTSAQRVRIGKPEVNLEVVVAGWGSLSKNQNTPSRILKYTNLKTTESDDSCTNDANFFCAVALNDGGPCEGDCGGPVVVRNKTGDVLIGVVTHPEHECASGHAERFTKVAAFVDWIAEVIGP